MIKQFLAYPQCAAWESTRRRRTGDVATSLFVAAVGRPQHDTADQRR